MRLASVREIAVASDGRLLVYPREECFDEVYRAAMGVSWDQNSGCLASQFPREWSLERWYWHIQEAVAQEYGCTLLVDSTTAWRNVPDVARSAIEESDRRHAD